jgi:hypothetical protein
MGESLFIGERLVAAFQALFSNPFISWLEPD